MAKCDKIPKKKSRVCIGDMDKQIILQNRQIVPPVSGSPDYDESFSTTATVWARIDTTTGKTYFDGVATDTPITHEIYIRYDATVTAETWIEYSSRRLDILKVENLQEQSEFMKLTCNDRGSTSNEASKA